MLLLCRVVSCRVVLYVLAMLLSSLLLFYGSSSCCCCCCCRYCRHRNNAANETNKLTQTDARMHSAYHVYIHTDSHKQRNTTTNDGCRRKRYAGYAWLAFCKVVYICIHSHLTKFTCRCCVGAIISMTGIYHIAVACSQREQQTLFAYYVYLFKLHWSHTQTHEQRMFL